MQVDVWLQQPCCGSHVVMVGGVLPGIPDIPVARILLEWRDDTMEVGKFIQLGDVIPGSVAEPSGTRIIHLIFLIKNLQIWRSQTVTVVKNCHSGHKLSQMEWSQTATDKTAINCHRGHKLSQMGHHKLSHWSKSVADCHRIMVTYFHGQMSTRCHKLLWRKGTMVFWQKNSQIVRLCHRGLVTLGHSEMITSHKVICPYWPFGVTIIKR